MDTFFDIIDKSPKLFYLVINLIVALPALFISFKLDKKRANRYPNTLTFKWGYFTGARILMASTIIFILGILVIASGEPDLAEVNVAMIGALSVLFIPGILILRRNRWAWIFYTIFSLNPLLWLINVIYIKKRWNEFVQYTDNPMRPAVENNLPSTQSKIKPPAFYNDKLKKSKKKVKYRWVWILFGLLCLYFIGMLVVFKDIKSSKPKSIERQTVTIHKQLKEELEEGYPQKHFLSDKQMKIPVHYKVLGEIAGLGGFIVPRLRNVTIFTIIGLIPFLFFKKTRQWKTPIYMLFIIIGWQYGERLADLYDMSFSEMNIQNSKIITFGILFLYFTVCVSVPIIIFQWLKNNKWKHLFWLLPLVFLYIGLKIDSQMNPSPDFNLTLKPQHYGYSLTLRDNDSLIHLEGRLKRGVSRYVAALLKDNPDIKGIILDTIGGRSYEGWELSKLILIYSLDTYSLKGCYSAGTIAFISGEKRFLGTGANLGFHQGYNFSESGLEKEQEEVLRIFKRKGVKKEFLDKIHDTSHEDIWRPSIDELLSAGVIHGVVNPSDLTPVEYQESIEGVILSPAVSLADADRIFKENSKAVVVVTAYDEKGNAISRGSGFIVRRDGAVVTNYHVIGMARDIKVKVGHKVLDVEGLIFADEKNDLVILKAIAKDMPVVKLGVVDKANIGEHVYVISSPEGLENTITEGLLSRIRKIDGKKEILQMTAPTSHGSSGGPVFNRDGEVIGIATFGSFSRKLSLAMPVKLIKDKISSKRVTAIKESGLEDYINTAMYWSYLGGIYISSGRYEEAIKSYKKAIKINPDSTRVHSNLGYAYKNLGMHKEAIEACKQAIRIDPDFAEAHVNLGGDYGNLGMYKEAIKSFKQAIRIDPDYATAHYNLGLACSSIGMHKEAIEDYKQAVMIDPDFAEAHVDLGLAYANLGKYKEAIDALKQAIRIKPDYAKAHYNLGVVHGNLLGMYEEAIKSFKQAIMIKPDFVEAHYNLGVIYASLKDRDSALEQYKILKNLDPKLANKLFNQIYK
ncbi:MAG: tetratricopeptide repeat protein [Candidatus Scalindua sp.]